MLRAEQLDTDRAMVLVIDFQSKLLPAIRHRDRVLRAACELLDGARVFDLPVLATEQNPKGIGVTDSTIRTRLDQAGSKIIEKKAFSCCGEEAVREALRAIDRPQILVIGIEAHVCVQQTALDLRTLDYDVCVCADAIGSRSQFDYECSLGRMRQAGVMVTTVESALFELCGGCDAKRFKAMLEVIKAYPPEED